MNLNDCTRSYCQASVVHVVFLVAHLVPTKICLCLLLLLIDGMSIGNKMTKRINPLKSSTELKKKLQVFVIDNYRLNYLRTKLIGEFPRVEKIHRNRHWYYMIHLQINFIGNMNSITYGITTGLLCR
jgi:hypothetical protein